MGKPPIWPNSRYESRAVSRWERPGGIAELNTIGLEHAARIASLALQPARGYHPLMRTLAIANHKGGCGKTALARELGRGWPARGGVCYWLTLTRKPLDGLLRA